MRLKPSQLLSSLAITIIILIVFNIFNAAFFPEAGFENFRIPINILLILYLGFKIESAYLPVLILVVQLFHGAFSAEGWAIGTFTGILISVVVSYTKELFNLATPIMTMIVTQVFQVLWFVITVFIYYAKLGDFSFFSGRIQHFLLESLCVSLLSPMVFVFLDKVWRVNKSDSIKVG